MMSSMARAAMQASLSLVNEQFSLQIQIIHGQWRPLTGQDADRAPLKLAEAEGEPVLDADAAGSHLRLHKRLRT